MKKTIIALLSIIFGSSLCATQYYVYETPNHYYLIPVETTSNNQPIRYIEEKIIYDAYIEELRETENDSDIRKFVITSILITIIGLIVIDAKMS